MAGGLPFRPRAARAAGVDRALGSQIERVAEQFLEFQVPQRLVVGEREPQWMVLRREMLFYEPLDSFPIKGVDYGVARSPVVLT